MKRTLAIIVVLVCAALALPTPIYALANVTSASHSCFALTATGTSNRSWVLFLAANFDFSKYKWEAVPVVAGTFSHTMDLTGVFTTHDAVVYQIYGTTAQVTSDGETASFFDNEDGYYADDLDLNCTPPTATPISPTATPVPATSTSVPPTPTPAVPVFTVPTERLVDGISIAWATLGVVVLGVLGFPIGLFMLRKFSSFLEPLWRR